MSWGTLSSFDTLASTQQSLIKYGLDNAFKAINDQLAAHNILVGQMASDLTERSEDRQRRYGAASSKVMQELDEFGVPDAQKVAAGVTVGFPLRKYGNAVQWTDLFLKRARADELAKEVVAIQDADIMNVYAMIRRALFTPTNSTFNDIWLDHVDIPVKALINADSSAIPPGPNGEVFNPATHTHYLANATLTSAALLSLVTTIIEHYASGTCLLYISATDEAAVRALTGFTATVDTRITQSMTTTYATGGLDMVNFNNRRIGVFGAADVWVKPWIPAGYAVAFMAGQKALVWRYDSVLNNGDLQMEWTDARYVLQCQAFSRYGGMGVWNRIAAAVLDFGHGSYTTPTGL